MKLTVGLFNDSYPPVMDGVGNTVQNYAYWLNKKHGKSYVITPKFPKYIDNDEFSVIRYYSTRLPLRPPYRLGLAAMDIRTKKILHDIDFDILHVHSPFSSGHLALKIARKKHIPIIATFHSKFYDDFKQALKSDFLAKLMVKRVIAFFEKVDIVWTVNNSTANTLREYGYKGPIEIMPNGNEYNANIDFEENKMYFKSEYGINEDELVLLFVGQHIWQKNIRLIVDSLKEIKNDGIKFKMIFIGEGYARAELMNIVESYKLNEAVLFMGKITDRELLKRFYARADLFLFPSVYDNAPIVIKEAAALKTPAIVVENSNAQEGIIDGVNGFTCSNDITSFVGKIKEAIEDRDRLRSIGEKAQETLAYTWEGIIDKASLRYQEIIEKYRDNHK